MNSSGDSNNSDESDSDSNHDTSTDGEPYMKNVCIVFFKIFYVCHNFFNFNVSLNLKLKS